MTNLEQEVGFKTFRALPPIHVLVKRCGFFFFALSVYLFNNLLALTLNEIAELKVIRQAEGFKATAGNRTERELLHKRPSTNQLCQSLLNCN